MNYFRQVSFLLGRNRRWVPSMALLFLLVSLLDVAGIGLVVPMVALLVDPSSVERYIHWWPSMNEWIGRVGPSVAVPWLAGALLLVFVVKTAMAGVVFRVIAGYARRCDEQLRALLLRHYQTMPYLEYTRRNSAEYVQALHYYVNQFCYSVLVTLLRLMSESMVGAVILVLLLLVDWKMTALFLGLLSCFLGFYDYFIRRKILRYGQASASAATQLIKGIHHTLDGLKEVRVLGVDRHFADQVKAINRVYSDSQARYITISSMPRYMIELALVTCLLTSMGVFLRFNGDAKAFIPILGMFTAAALRLAPSTSLIVAGVNNLRYFRPAVERLYQDLAPAAGIAVTAPTPVPPSPATVEKFASLQLRQVRFQYLANAPWVLQGIDLDLRAGECIGLIGSSGAGKTTLVDIMLGLLQPQHGDVLLNATPLRDDLERMRQMVAYLSQQIFLLDDSLRRNVAFGLDDALIDDEKVWAALQQARLATLARDWPEGLDTRLGERGIRLSGGQRQRVALARAFYHRRQVLVMDEATSALDTETEQEIVEEIQQLRGNVTLVIIAHRHTTLSHCDRIYELREGRIARVCRYDELSAPVAEARMTPIVPSV